MSHTEFSGSETSPSLSGKSVLKPHNIFLSVVVPVYNVEQYLRRSIESVLKQNFASMEVIIVNDGSTDGSGKMCDEFAKTDARVQVIHQSNKGVSCARNVGLDHSKGKYITFLDADDSLDENTYSRILSYVDSYDVDFVSFNDMYVSQDGKIIRHNANNGEVSLLINNIAILEHFFQERHGGTLAVYLKIFKASVIRGVRFDEVLHINEDKLFLYNAFKRCSTGLHVNLAVYKYYRRAGSASGARFNEHYFDMKKVAVLIEQDVRTVYPDSRVLRVESSRQKLRALVMLFYCMSISKAAQQKYKREYQSIRHDIRKLGLMRLYDPVQTIQPILIAYVPKLYALIATRRRLDMEANHESA